MRVLLLVATAAAAVGPAPRDLLCEHMASPSMGVSSHQPRFNWVLSHQPSCGVNQKQHSFQLQLAARPTFGKSPSQSDSDIFTKPLWDSGRIESEVHLQHTFAQQLLLPGETYFWRLKAWSHTGTQGSAVCESEWSDTAIFSTSLWDGFQNASKPIWSPTSGSRYTFFRKDVALTQAFSSAVAYVTAAQSGGGEKLLGAYRLYVNGVTVGIGPGRGEVYVKDAGHTMYDTIDISSRANLSTTTSTLQLALQCFHADGGSDARVLLELHLTLGDGSKMVVSTDASWVTVNAHDLFNPASQTSGGGYTAPQENINGSAFPSQKDWTTAPASAGEVEGRRARWVAAVVRAPFENLVAKPTLPLELVSGRKPVRMVRVANSSSHFFFDMGEAMMGGVRLELPGPVPANVNFEITLSEELVGDYTNSTQVLYPMRTGNHYRHVFTTGAGAGVGAGVVMVMENHEYMLFRYGEVVISNGTRNQTATCSEVAENSRLSIHCEGVNDNQKISKISFASYGTPSGGCNADKGDTFRINSACHAKNSQAVVEKLCLHKQACSITADNLVFGDDPCHLKAKFLAVDAECSSSSSTGAGTNTSHATVRYYDDIDVSEANMRHFYMAPASANANSANGANGDDGGVDGIKFELSTWQVRYPWSEGDSSFESSDEMLNRVWQLCRDTLRITSLDTTTDSNTRERLPYEADGAITGSSRYIFQREWQWQRHSSAHNFLNPTWPTEWRQFMPLMALADYMQTGDTSLFTKFHDLLAASTQEKCINADNYNLVDFSAKNHDCKRSCEDGKSTCKDNIDWPMNTRDGYVLSDVSTVINAFAVAGLRAMSAMANATGDAAEAGAFGGKAEAVAQGINDAFIDSKTQLYVDGTGSSDASKHSAWHAQTNPLWVGGIVPASMQKSLVSFLQKKRMAGSVYGAYAFLLGLYNADSDHGKFALEMMTTCDTSSWCHMLSVGATATMEAWSRTQKPNLSWSHPWATAPATAIAQGFMGLTALAPKFARFMYKPQPGNATSGKISLPTFSGSIGASFTVADSSFTATVKPPPSTIATVCLPKSKPNLMVLDDTTLTVDGKAVQGYAKGDYVCVDDIGSGGASGRVVVRKLT